MEILKQDLLTIFDCFKQVIIAPFRVGGEQDVLFVDLADLKADFNKPEQKYLTYKGQLQFSVPQGKMNEFILHEKMELFYNSEQKKNNVIGKLTIEKGNSPLHYDNFDKFFTKYSMNFTYFLKRDFNKIRVGNTDLDLIIKEIEND
ncbi:MAG: hypothetical protein Ta2D_05480 [Rickettsiales bacterium]|nr:MAG: hypothetical protein Ta2D_05480 [Rickettsiales bacterium]